MSSIGSVSVEIQADIQQFEAGLAEARGMAQSFDNQLKQLDAGSAAFIRATE